MIAPLQGRWWRHARIPVGAMLAVVMLARSLVPAGFMPAPGAGFTLIFCSGYSQPSHDPAAPAKSDTHDGASSLCPFAAAASGASAPMALADPVQFGVAADAVPAAHPPVPPGLPGPPRSRPPRGPPIALS